LADGRLEEAYELARRDKVRSHRRGQSLVGRLVEALARRAESHLDSGRLHEATADCEKAASLGGNQPELARLRAKALEAALAQQKIQRDRARALVEAQALIEQGRLADGQAMLTPVVAQESRAAYLLREAQARQADITAAAARAESALAQNDWEAAAAVLAHVQPADLAQPPLAALVGRLGGAIVSAASQAIDRGELLLAESMLSRLTPLGCNTIQAERLGQALLQCHQTWDLLARDHLRQAEEAMRRVSSLLPSAKWVEPSLKQIRAAADAVDQVRAGPIGVLSSSPAHAVTLAASAAPKNGSMKPGAGGTPAASPVQASPHLPAEALPFRFLLQVDGAGSYLVLRRPMVSVGPVSSPLAPDVGLMAEASAPVAVFERLEDDYFVRSDQTIEVNGRPCQRKLLKDNDEIALAPRCRLRFRMPNAASTSAALDLSGARLMRSDVRRVILLDREIIVGPGTSTHVRLDESPEQVVLSLRDGRLFGHDKRIGSEGLSPHSQPPIAVGSHVRLGAVSFVIART
jgi:hypothetical protein